MWHTWTSLIWALCVSASWAWRSECEIEGVDVKVTVHGTEGGETADASSRTCRAAYIDTVDLASIDNLAEIAAGVDVIFTDSLVHVPFAGRNGPLLYLENISLYMTDNFDEVMSRKTRLLSILLPPLDDWDALAEDIYRQAKQTMPDDIFIDDGSLELHMQAFQRYRFSLIADDLGRQRVSQPFVHCMGLGTIPVFNGVVELGAMFFNGVADFEAEEFSLPRTLDTIRDHNEQLGALWHYHRMIQDQLQYRFNRPFEERLVSQACSACRLRLAGEAPLVFVGIYSARGNFDKRNSVRETWLQILRHSYNARYRFFLGEGFPSGSEGGFRLLTEIQEHDDIVFLPISDGYRMNSRKGALFLEWVAENTAAEFLLKVDDDVYFRPFPLLTQLRSRSPIAYAWGLFDYISPVPREPEDNFYNTVEDFPFDVFPPYPRGVVRVLSMDIVRLLAKASKDGRLRYIYGDDPCLGVHLRQLLYDVEEPIPSLTLDDFDSNRVFAMEPSCNPNLWSRITAKTWVVHHVKPDQIRCMWNADVEAGYYKGSVGQQEAGQSFGLDALPDLCGCAFESEFETRTDKEDLRKETDEILGREAGSGETEL